MSATPASESDATPSERLMTKLDRAGVSYHVSHHVPVYTSEEAARVRNTPLASGAKALVLKVDSRWVMLVLPADRKLDSRKLRSALAARNSRFGTPEEVLHLTGLRPGSIPPFGSVFGIETYCDPALAANSSINFNAGEHTISISMPYADYVRVENPRLVEFSSL